MSAAKLITLAQSEYLFTVREDVLRDLSGRNINATNFARNSLRVVQNSKFNAQIRGASYMPFLFSFNKKKSPQTVGKSFVNNVIDWMKAKGVRPQRNGLFVSPSPVNYRRAAFAIAQGITESGNKYKKVRGVDMTQHLKDNKNSYLNDVSRALLTAFTDKVN